MEWNWGNNGEVNEFQGEGYPIDFVRGATGVRKPKELEGAPARAVG